MRRRNGAASADVPEGGEQTLAPISRLEMVRQAARAHFAAHGYEAASMRDIAADAGIHIATLYFYCSTKEQLLFDVLKESFEQIQDSLREQIAAAGETYAARLAAGIALHVKLCAEKAFPTTFNRVDIQRLSDEHRAEYISMRDAYERELRDLISCGIAAGEFRPVDPKLTAFAIVGIGHTVGYWYRPDGPLTPEQIGAQYVDLILTSLQRPAAGILESPPRRAVD